MRFAGVVFAAFAVVGLSLAAQSPASSSAHETHELSDVLPASVRVDQFALSADGQRTYFVNSNGEAWLYDRARKTSTRVAAGPLWDLNVSPAGDGLAYTRGGDRRGDQFVWALALDPATGLARGAERRVSEHQGDVPSISPDGKLVAFARDDASGVGQSVVVVPTGGGAERVVAAAIPSSLANIRWTPDGQTLYLGVNPPVACVPDWSCLPLAGDLRQPAGSIRRVAVSGGPVTTVAPARGATPGLSPDGTTLMYLDVAQGRRWVVASADATRRDTVTLPSTQTPIGWLRGSTLLISSGGNLRRLRAMSIADGTSQVLSEGSDTQVDPTWSPDGALMMTSFPGQPRGSLRILNAAGSQPQSVTLPETYASNTSWSPDQRWVAFIGSDDQPHAHIAVVEIATGRVQRLYDLSNDQSASFRWRADSTGLILTELFGRPENNRRVVFRTLDLTGGTTLLREFPLGPPPSAGFAIDDATAIVRATPQSAYRVVGLSGDGRDRDLQPAPPSDAPPASLSPDGQWLTWRRQPTAAEGAQGTALELVRVDGSARRIVVVPFAAAGNPRVLAGGNDVIVVEAKRPDADSGVYLVSTTTQAVRKLFTYPLAPPEFSVSSDGRRLLYLQWETVAPSVLTMDLSAGRGR